MEAFPCKPYYAVERLRFSKNIFNRTAHHPRQIPGSSSKSDQIRYSSHTQLCELHLRISDEMHDCRDAPNTP
jgi:hypothetical protein